MRAHREQEDEPGQPSAVVDTVLGDRSSPSPSDVADGTTPLLEMDRLDVGTPVGDLGTEQISPR